MTQVLVDRDALADLLGRAWDMFVCLAEESGYGGGQWRELMVVAPNPSTQNNLTYCYLATGVERLGEQHLDATEDIRVHLFSGAEVRDLLESGRIRQALMAAPLWRYAAEYGL